jgi:hypothetical protein
MNLQEPVVAALCGHWRDRAKVVMRDADTLSGARDQIRLTAIATTLEGAAGELAAAARIALPLDGPKDIVPAATAHPNVVQLKSAGPVPSGSTGEKRIELQHIDLNRLFRAHVEPLYKSSPERFAYVDASDSGMACHRIAKALAGLEYAEVADVAERISDCQSAKVLIREGVSEDRVLRIFELTRSVNRIAGYVKEPLFLLDAPAVLIWKWASLPWDKVLFQ